MSEQYYFQRSNFHRQQSTDRKAKTPFRGFRFKETTGLIQQCTQAACRDLPRTILRNFHLLCSIFLKISIFHPLHIASSCT